jgi:anti-sigma regulatory factor (Ser/Thr protein kinase)
MGDEPDFCLPARPLPATSVSRRFAASTESAALVRHWLHRRLVAAGVAVAIVRRVELMASELATNAVLHAGGDRFLVHLSMADADIEVTVQDGSATPPVPRRAAPDEAGGRGLAIVGALSRAWGMRPIRGGGKAIWFRVDGVRVDGLRVDGADVRPVT